MGPTKSKRLLRAVALISLVIAGYAAIRVAISAHSERRWSEIEAVSTLAVDYVLDPTDARWRTLPFAADFDVTSSSSVVVRNGNYLYEIAHRSQETVFSVVKVNGPPPESFAIDNDDTLLTIAGGYFGMLNSTGDTMDAVPLPFDGMHLARSALNGVIYLYGGANSDYRLYSFADNGAFRILVQLDEPIMAVADNQHSTYIATATRIFRLRDQHLSLLLKAGEGEIGDSIISVAALTSQRFGREKFPDHALDVFVKLRQLAFGVALADDEQIDFLGRRAVLDHVPHASSRLAFGRIHEARRRIDQRRPELLKRAVRIALLDHQLHRLLRPRKAHRFRERAGAFLRLVGRLPLAEHGGESARVDGLIRVAVDDLEVVVAKVE